MVNRLCHEQCNKGQSGFFPVLRMILEIEGEPLNSLKHSANSHRCFQVFWSGLWSALCSGTQWQHETVNKKHLWNTSGPYRFLLIKTLFVIIIHAVHQQAFFSADISTCHTMKSTGAANNIRMALFCSSVPVSHDSRHNARTLTLKHNITLSVQIWPNSLALVNYSYAIIMLINN